VKIAFQDVREEIQIMAHTKPGAAIAAGTATAPAWIDWVVTSQAAQAGIIIVGVVLSLTIIAINVQTFLQRRKKD